MSFDAYDISLGGNFVRKLGKQKVTSSGEIFRTNTRAPRPRPPKYRAPKHSGKHLIGRQVIIKSIRSAEAQAAGPFPPAELSSVPEGVEEETVVASVLPQKSVEVSPSLSATSSSSNEPSPLLTPAAAPSIPSIKRSFRMRPAAPVIAFGENKLSDSPGAAPSSCILMPVSHIEHELKNPSPWFKSAQIQPLHSVESIAHSDPEFPSLATAQNASIPSSSLKLRGRARGFRPLSQVVSEQSSVVDVAEFLSSDDFVSDSDFDRLSVFSDAPVVVRAPTPAVPSQPSPQSTDADVSDDEWQLL